MLPRLGLIILAADALFLSVLPEGQIWRDIHNIETLTPVMRASRATYAILLSGIGLALMAMSCTPRVAKAAERFALVAGLFILSLVSLSAINLLKTYGLDSGAAPNYAAELLLQGKNPYASFILAEAIGRYGMPQELITRFTDGSLKENFMYPAGSFLSLVPAVALGLPDVRPLYALALVALALITHYIAPAHLKVLALAAFVTIQLANTSLVGSGVTEPWWVLPVTLAWVLRSRWKTSAGLVGYALSLKQLTWFFAPFHVIMVYHQHGLKKAAASAGIAAAVFAVMNAPFFLLSPGPWMASILSPMTDPEPALGVGPALMGIQLLPQLPRTFYSTISFGVLAASAAWFLLKCRGLPLLALVLPWVPLWFGWRSLSTYFLYLPIMLIIGLMHESSKNGVLTGEESQDDKLSRPV